MNKSTNNPNRRMEFKEYLLKEVALLKGVGQIEISALFYFIDYLMLLPDDLSQQLRKEILLFVWKEELEMVQFREEDLSPTLAAIIEMGHEDGIVQGRKQGRKQGREQGLEQGKLLEKKETAKQLLKLSMPIEQIVIVTALSVDEIETLKKELNI